MTCQHCGCQETAEKFDQWVSVGTGIIAILGTALDILEDIAKCVNALRAGND